MDIFTSTGNDDISRKSQTRQISVNDTTTACVAPFIKSTRQFITLKNLYQNSHNNLPELSKDLVSRWLLFKVAFPEAAELLLPSLFGSDDIVSNSFVRTATVGSKRLELNLANSLL